VQYYHKDLVLKIYHQQGQDRVRQVHHGAVDVQNHTQSQNVDISKVHTLYMVVMIIGHETALSRCPKPHPESECRHIKGTYFICGVLSVGSSEAMIGRGRGGIPPTRGRGVMPHNKGGQARGQIAVYAVDVTGLQQEMGEHETEESDKITQQVDLMACILLISGQPAYVLIDTGCSHSVISSGLIEKYGWQTSSSERTIEVHTPLGLVMQVVKVCRGMRVKVAGRDLIGDLLVMDIEEYDMLLGMDWLTKHGTTIDCPHRIIRFEGSSGSFCML
jgi:Retroviral aspartyl protease